MTTSASLRAEGVLGLLAVPKGAAKGMQQGGRDAAASGMEMPAEERFLSMLRRLGSAEDQAKPGGEDAAGPSDAAERPAPDSRLLDGDEASRGADARGSAPELPSLISWRSSWPQRMAGRAGAEAAETPQASRPRERRIAADSQSSVSAMIAMSQGLGMRVSAAPGDDDGGAAAGVTSDSTVVASKDATPRRSATPRHVAPVAVDAPAVDKTADAAVDETSTDADTVGRLIAANPEAAAKAVSPAAPIPSGAQAPAEAQVPRAFRVAFGGPREDAASAQSGGADDEGRVKISVVARETHLLPASPGERKREAPTERGRFDRAGEAETAAPAPMRGDPNGEATNRTIPHARPALRHAAEIPVAPAASNAAPATDASVAPAAQPIEQVARAVHAAIDGVDPAADAASVPSTPAEPAVTAKAPVKILRIALRPDHLGDVAVQLRHSASGLHVSVVAEQADTARLLERDHQLLARTLDASGIKVDGVAIRAAGADASGQPAASFAQAGGNPAGGGQLPAGGGAASGQQQGSRQSSTPFHDPQETTDETPGDSGGARRGLYV